MSESRNKFITLEGLEENGFFKAEKEAERYFGKIVLLLSEEKAIELPFLARLLYLPYRKLYYWLVKRRLWNDWIKVEKRERQLWVSLGGPFKCWLAAVYSLQEPKPNPEFGNEIFKRMVSIGEGYIRAIFARKLEDDTIVMYTFDVRTRNFLFHLQLKPEEILTNGIFCFNPLVERVRKAYNDAVKFFGFAKYTLSLETIHVVIISSELLQRAFKEVVVIPEKQS